MILHIRQNAVIVFLEILVTAVLLCHRAAVTAYGICLIIQLCGRASKAERNLPNDKLRGGITGVGVF